MGGDRCLKEEEKKRVVDCIPLNSSCVASKLFAADKKSEKKKGINHHFVFLFIFLEAISFFKKKKVSMRAPLSFYHLSPLEKKKKRKKKMAGGPGSVMHGVTT